MYPQTDIFGVVEVSQKKISTSLWSPNGGIFLKPVKRYNMSSKEIPFISPLATAAKNISKSQAKFSDILCAFYPSSPFFNTLILCKKCSKVSWYWTGIKKHFILSEFSFKVEVRSTFSNSLINCSIAPLFFQDYKAHCQKSFVFVYISCWTYSLLVKCIQISLINILKFLL